MNTVQKEKLFTELDAYLSGDFEPGLFVVSGKPSDGVSLETARKAIEAELERMKQDRVPEYELEKGWEKFLDLYTEFTGWE